MELGRGPGAVVQQWVGLLGPVEQTASKMACSGDEASKTGCM